jgi:hypothetical protein
MACNEISNQESAPPLTDREVGNARFRSTALGCLERNVKGTPAFQVVRRRSPPEISAVTSSPTRSAALAIAIE